MDVIRHNSVINNNAILKSSNIPLDADGYPTWSAGTYTRGQRVVEGIQIYEVVADSTTDQPTVGEVKEVKTWVRVSYINRFRMFEPNTSTLSSSNTGTITTTLNYGSALVSAIAFFGLVGESINVKMIDSTEGTVYDETLTLSDALVDNWFDWFFAPYEIVMDVVFVDLPPYLNADIIVTITGITGATTTECAYVNAGEIVSLGQALDNTRTGIIDFSVREADAFGVFNIVERKKTKRASFEVKLPTDRTAFVQRFLEENSTIPCVFIGETSLETTILAGYYRTFDITLQKVFSDLTIDVEGV